MRKLAFIAYAMLYVGCSGGDFAVAQPLAEADTEVSDAVSEETSRDAGADTDLDTSAPSDDSGKAPEASVDTGGDSDSGGGVDAVPDAHEHTVVAWPSTEAMGFNATSGMYDNPLKIGYCRSAGDYAEETVTRATPGARVKFTINFDDQTQGCAKGATQSWAVKLDGVKVGTMSFVTPAMVAGDRTLTAEFTVIVPAGTTTIRLQAETAVCVGGGSWAWRSGGKVEVD